MRRMGEQGEQGGGRRTNSLPRELGMYSTYLCTRHSCSVFCNVVSVQRSKGEKRREEGESCHQAREDAQGTDKSAATMYVCLACSRTGSLL